MVGQPTDPSRFDEKDLLERLITDPHSPPLWRVNGILPHIKEFYNCFNINETDNLYIKDIDRVNRF